MRKDRFVNPYAFLPLAQEVRRRPLGRPEGETNVVDTISHDVGDGRAAELLSGSITLAYELKTDMLLPVGGERDAVDKTGRVILPGSTLKGATRSLHEALFNGCFRVVDLDFVPGYRMAAVADESDTWRLALVTLSDRTGSPTEVRLCDDEVWLDSGQLFNAYPQKRLPRSGDVIEVHGPNEEWSSLGRFEMSTIKSVDLIRAQSSGDVASLRTVQGLIFQTTDVGARQEWRRPRDGQRRKGRCLWASGLLGSKILPIPAAVAKDFRAAVSGSNDRRVLLARDDDSSGANHHAPWRSQPVHENVAWWRLDGTKGTVAERTLHTGFLWPGDVVWVKKSPNDTVEALRLSQLWRKPGRGSVGERLRVDLHPCNPSPGSGGLCLSCAVFGAIDNTGDSGEGRQSAYASHVRFGALKSRTSVSLAQVDLAPLGSPQPGNAMFYLDSAGAPAAQRRRGDRASEWGSEAEGGKSRIAGRKFYWHGDPRAQAEAWSRTNGSRVEPRYAATPDQRTGKMSRRAWLVPRGTVFDAKVTFDALDRTSLTSVLWALDPALAISKRAGGGAREVAIHLGGGRPFGLGSATVTVTDAHIQNLADRYRMPSDVGLELSASAFAGADTAMTEITDRVGPISGNLEAASWMLDLNGLGENAILLAYPPGATWSEANTEQFRKSYEFFVQANGERLSNSTRPWYPLPRPGGQHDVSLPIVEPRGRYQG